MRERRIYNRLIVSSPDHAVLKLDLGGDGQSFPQEPVVEVGEIALTPGTEVTGRVITASGTPVAGAALLLKEWDSHPTFLPARSMRIGRSDTTGEFLLRHVAPTPGNVSGLFAVAPEGMGFTRIDVLHQQALLAGVEIRLFATASLEVTVQDPEGQPVPDAVVEVIPIKRPFVMLDWSHSAYLARDPFPSRDVQLGDFQEVLDLLRAETDETGRASFDSLPAGFPASIRVQAPGYLTALLEVVHLEADAPLKVSVDLDRISMRAVSGRVVTLTGAPVSGAVVRCYRFRSTGWSYSSLFGETSTDAEGRFNMGKLAADSTIDLVVAKDPFATRRVRLHVPVSEDLSDEEIVLERSVPVAGVVVDQYGAPVPGVRISLLRDGGGVSSDQELTGDGGRFTVSSATSGEWTLQASLPEPGAQWRRRSVTLPVNAGDRSVRVVAEREAVGHAAVVVRIAELSTVSPVTPEVAKAARIEATGMRPDWPGRVRFEDVKADRWQLVVEAEGFSRSRQEFDVTPADLTVSLRVDLVPRGSIAGSIRLSDPEASAGLADLKGIRVSLVDAEGWEAPSARVRYGESSDRLEFEFTDLDSGPVELELSGGLIGRQTALVVGGRETQVEIEAILGGQVFTQGAGRHTEENLRICVFWPDGEQRTFRLSTAGKKGGDWSLSLLPGAVDYVIRSERLDQSAAADADLPIIARGSLQIHSGQRTTLEIPPPPNR